MLLLNTDRAAFVAGDYRSALAQVGYVGAVIADPPYGARTHKGHDNGVRTARRAVSGSGGATNRRKLSYAPWTPDDVRGFMEFWAPRCTGWMAAMSCHLLSQAWEDYAVTHGRVTFQPVPLVIRGMTVRLSGDGPSSWCVWINISRPRRSEFVGGWTRPGAYVGGRGSVEHIGGKPLWAMSRIVRDYTRPGDLVVDPCAGYGTTGVAALGLDKGLSFLGAELDGATAGIAATRLAQPDHGVKVAAALEDGAEFFDVVDPGNSPPDPDVDEA